MVRGISDFADDTKSTTDGEGWQARAVASAAAFVTALAEEIGKELSDSSAPGADGSQGGGPFNLATGNARVGFQSQNVTINGGIQLGGQDKEGGTTALMARAEVRPGKLKLILNGSQRFLRNLADLAASVTAVITAIRTVA